MDVIVVYESMFGNTQMVARALAEGLAADMHVTDVVEVGTAPTTLTEGLDLVVAGGPTHQFGMSRSSSRATAAGETDDELVSPGIGLREWVTALEKGFASVGAAAFDTRVQLKPKPLPGLTKPHLVPGSAAHGAERRLRKLGFHIVAPAESFAVETMSGPLVAGEEDRAREWGRYLGSLSAHGTSNDLYQATE
jgi:hypothetical protein